MRRIAYGISTAVVIAAAGSVAAQKTTEVHPGKGGSPHVRTRVDDRRRQHLDQVQAGRQSRDVRKPDLILCPPASRGAPALMRRPY